ncbi:LOW QUALITY PROTEIN: hypothetical protein PHMEG_0004253 [Phytophthora megakarya]|uniref:Uncharacterized protein n=1 Tax=Phytophthora megakarya TaxID=4795 RepID=A0A225WVV4_9STRA|nr:LOW QUALITY PROTEIN: hypothetical protein PHMEG_0004253 [Phytophthora megakarya]
MRNSLDTMLPAAQQAVISNLTSHSLRRGSAAYANACSNLAIQPGMQDNLTHKRRLSHTYGQQHVKVYVEETFSLVTPHLTYLY